MFSRDVDSGLIKNSMTWKESSACELIDSLEKKSRMYPVKFLLKNLWFVDCFSWSFS